MIALDSPCTWLCPQIHDDLQKLLQSVEEGAEGK